VGSVGWSDLLGGVVAGVIASTIAWGISRLYRLRRNRIDFGRLAGEYRVREKQPSEEADGTVTLRGNGPVLDLAWTLGDRSEVRGTVSMNEQSRVSGAGSYDHVRGENYGWGYFSLQVAEGERGPIRLLVDGRFTDQKARQQIAGAWVWEMQKATLREWRLWRLRLL
jgi:hypothetical protein